MHPFLIGAGWKMNKTAKEARDYVTNLRTLLPDVAEKNVCIFIVPPFTALSTVREAIGDGPLLLGAQNMHWAEAGAYTGEISIGMLREFDVGLVELGHSERRALFGETDDKINRKVKIALRHGIRPLICVGESGDERDAGASLETVIRQVKLAFHGVSADDLGHCLIAYEPIWAIGEHGVPATPDHVRNVHSGIREVLADFTPHVVPVIYGGSVNQETVTAFAREAVVDGLFIGRAALPADDFASLIVNAVAARAGRHH